MSPTLSIVLPAYNEEDAIGAAIEACLAAEPEIRKETGLAAVEIVVVDDGSRDRTREIAAGFQRVRIVVHPRNRGYGAALMTGFEAARGDYLAFMDADGTIDPLCFIALLRELTRAGADLAIGGRLHPGSRMPFLRSLGNHFYAAVVSRLTGVRVTDTASGVRLFSRTLLPRLLPLPEGLHFTPAMTARAACMGAKIVETPIPYAERLGRSKLNVLADGMRFLRVILGIVFSYYPLRIFGPAGLVFAAVALGYAVRPVSQYLALQRLEDPEDMIYRLLTIVTLAVCSLICLTFGGLAQKLSDIAVRRGSGFWDHPRVRDASLAAGVALVLAGVLLNTRTIVEYVTSRQIHQHWIYVLTGSLTVISGTVLGSFGVTLDLVRHLPSGNPSTGTGLPGTGLPGTGRPDGEVEKP
ncbi:MAG: glycosyltransferase family 2 protein [Elusimicrobia bacterium]|nr:glycosyltransferase family 2 protein [Elusimicrobiota bacterium]